METFSGCGRMYDIYNNYQPTGIVMVDHCQAAIDHAKKVLAKKKEFHGLKEIKTDFICSDVLSWCRQEKGKFGVSVALWGLCYLDQSQMKEYLEWIRDHVELQVFIEPVFKNVKKHKEEQWLDEDQQMIKRSATWYFRFFKDHDLAVLNIKDFATNNLGPEVDPSGCRCWVIVPMSRINLLKKREQKQQKKSLTNILL